MWVTSDNIISVVFYLRGVHCSAIVLEHNTRYTDIQPRKHVLRVTYVGGRPNTQTARRTLALRSSAAVSDFPPFIISHCHRWRRCDLHIFFVPLTSFGTIILPLSYTCLTQPEPEKAISMCRSGNGTKGPADRYMSFTIHPLLRT